MQRARLTSPRLAYSPLTAVLRREVLIALHEPPPSPIPSHLWGTGALDVGDLGVGMVATSAGPCPVGRVDLGVGSERIEIEAEVTLHEGVAAGIVYRPLGAPEHNLGDVIIGLDAAEQTAFAATLPAFIEIHRRRHAVEHGRTYHLRSSIRPPRLELYVDDLLTVQCALAPRDMGTPSIGLFVQRSARLAA